jgi:hypothetical protein
VAEPKKRVRRELVAVAEALPADVPTPEPPLQAHQLHTALDRATIWHLELTDALRQLKTSWVKRNVEAAQCHQSIPVAEIKHVEAQRREAHLELEKTQSEIGQLNKLLREHKARQAVKLVKDQPDPKAQSDRKDRSDLLVHERMPESAEQEISIYFMLAAQNELSPALYARIEQVAAALRRDAQKMGLD